LDRLGDFYLRRGAPGDADRAFQSYEDSRAIDQRLLKASPDDAQAARDLSVSLNRLGDFYLRRGAPGDADRAFQSYEDCHETLQRLLKASPVDAQAARDLSVSHYNLARIFNQRGDETRERMHLSACYAILDAFHRDGRPMDPDMRQLHGRLAGRFGGVRRAEPADAAIEAILANDQARAQLDAALKASGITGGLEALSPEQQRDIVRQVLARSEGSADDGQQKDASDAGVPTEPRAATAKAPATPATENQPTQEPEKPSPMGAILGVGLILSLGAVAAFVAANPGARAALGGLITAIRRALGG